MMLKFIYSKKASKYLKSLQIHFDVMLFKKKCDLFTIFLAFSKYTNCINFLMSSQAPAPNAQFFSLIHFKSPHA
jgi:hypothetical protein